MIAPGSVTQWERATRLQADLEAARACIIWQERRMKGLDRQVAVLSFLVSIAFAVGFIVGGAS